MEFIIKTVQLQIEKYIQQPQADGALPTYAVFSADIFNMFNSIPREEIQDIIWPDYLELLLMAVLLYGKPGTCHYRWEDRSWCTIWIRKGANYGCPVLFLRPLDSPCPQSGSQATVVGDTRTSKSMPPRRGPGR